MKLYRVSTWRQHMYEDKSCLLPARNGKAAIAFARLFWGPGNWSAREVTQP